MTEKLTAGERALIRLMRRHSARAIDGRHPDDARDIRTAQRAGLVQRLDYEATVAGDDFLNSPRGRSAWIEAERKWDEERAKELDQPSEKP